MRGANASKVEVQTIMDVYARVAFYGGGASLKKFECEGASHNVATAGFGLHLVTWLPLLNFGKAELKDLSNVDVLLGTGLYMSGPELICEFLGLLRLHLSGWSVRRSRVWVTRLSVARRQGHHERRERQENVARNEIESSPALQVDLGAYNYTWD